MLGIRIEIGQQDYLISMYNIFTLAIIKYIYIISHMTKTETKVQHDVTLMM